MSKEKPILFSAPMINAIMAGNKTQTRRLVKWKPRDMGFNLAFSGMVAGCYANENPTSGYVLRSRSGDVGMCWNDRTWPAFCPYGAPGDTLWVRETWYCDDYTAGDLAAARVGYVGEGPSDEDIVKKWKSALDFRATHDCGSYEAGCPCSDEDGRSGWRPSIFMPRWASRLTLEVLSVRVERLMSITDQDTLAEGVERATPDGYVFGTDDGKSSPAGTPRSAFKLGWDTINGARAPWETNPWVWVVSFKDVTP